MAKILMMAGSIIVVLSLLGFLVLLLKGRGLRANGTKTYAKKLIHCLN